MDRTFVILRHTFWEAIVQPIYSLLLGIGGTILVVFGLLPFFTLGEDTIMYKAVALDVVLLIVLVMTLFATSRSIFEEIEDRTMLTLMSKPIRRWEVLVGKYLGIIGAAALAIVIFGSIIMFCTYFRIATDYQIRQYTMDEGDLKLLHDYRVMHLAGLVPSFVMVWLQISVLAAIGVALSTRFSLVVNLPTVILIYIAGNLTRFLFPLAGRTALVKAFGYVASSLLPFLQVFDMRSLTLYHDIGVPGTNYYGAPGAVPLSVIWTGVLLAGAYGIAYATFALGAGMWLFETRELGGAEG